ncbi:MAG: hypothetical protein J5784_03025 [Muribaculaceae bacterium]|nr:hypothetical protein [Muribaculaceae bacterium]
MPNYTRSLSVFFDLKLTDRDIPLFRGAVLSCIGVENSLLFHNHSGDKYRYSYPLVQYKRLQGNAAIVCIGDGVDQIGRLISEEHDALHIGQRVEPFIITSVRPARVLLQLWRTSFNYHIHNWLPLNPKNYHIFNQIDGEAEKVLFLEKILKGNLLSMLKGLGVFLEDELIVKITRLGNPKVLHYKGTGMTSFCPDFKSNLLLPNYIGIGKNASIGFGIIYRKDNKNDK